MASDSNADVADRNIQLLQDAVAKNAQLEEAVGHEIDRISGVFIDHFVDYICIKKAGDLKAFNNDSLLFKSWLPLTELRYYFDTWSPNNWRTKNQIIKVNRNQYVIRFHWC